MNRRKLKILEDAFSAEIESALGNSAFPIIQTKSKLAKELADQGYLQIIDFVKTDKFGEFCITGYALTEMGRLVYCESLR